MTAKSTTTKSKISETHQTTDNREQQNQKSDDGVTTDSGATQ
jgi:hypothetical protein